MKKSILTKVINYYMPEKGVSNFVKNESIVYASKNSLKRRSIPLLMKKYGNGFPKFYLKTYVSLIKSMQLVRKSYKNL